MAEKGENRNMTDTNGDPSSKGTPVRRSTRLNSASTPAPQTGGASTPKSKAKPTGPSSENSAAVRRSLRLSVSKPASPEDKLLRKVVTRRASTNAVSTPRRQSQDTKEGDHASASKARSRRCVSESPTKKDETTESNVIPARRSTRASTGASSTPSKQLWSSKSRKNLAAVTEDPSESPGMIPAPPPVRKIAYEEVVSGTPPEKQHSNIDHIQDSPSRPDQKNEDLQVVPTHMCEQLHVNTNGNKHLVNDFTVSTNLESTKTSEQLHFPEGTETLEESTSKQPQIINIKGEKCDTQSEDVALTRNPSNQITSTVQHITSKANRSPPEVAIASSAEDDINMSADKPHLTEESVDSCVIPSSLKSDVNMDGNDECYLPISADPNVSVSNGSTETADHKNSQAESRQLPSEILPQLEKENNDMFQVDEAAAVDDNKHSSLTEVQSGLNSCDTYADKQTSIAEDSALDDFHLEINACDNSDDDDPDVKIDNSPTLMSIHREVLNVSNVKPEKNDIQHEDNNTVEYPQITQDANADDEKENDSMCTNMDHITADAETSANSFFNKTTPQSGNKITKRLSNSSTKCSSVGNLSAKEVDKRFTPASTTPNRDGFIMDSTILVFESKDSNNPGHNISNKYVEKVRNSECNLTVEDASLNAHSSDENPPASNDADNCTSEDKPSNMQQDQANSNNDDDDDIFSEGSLSFDSDAMKTKHCQSETRHENVTTLGRISQPSPPSVPKASPESPDQESSCHMFNHSPKVVQDNAGSKSVMEHCGNNEFSCLERSSTPKVKKGKRQLDPLPSPAHNEGNNLESSCLESSSTPEVKKGKRQLDPVRPPAHNESNNLESSCLERSSTPKEKKRKSQLDPVPSPAHNESNNLEISARDSLQDTPPSIKSNLTIQSTSQEEIELSTLDDSADTCKKRSKKKSLDRTKVTLMECTKAGLPEDESSFSKKKRLTDFDSPSINLPSKRKKGDDTLAPNVSLKETVVAMMQLTDNPKPGRKVPEMSKEAQERIDQHIAEYLSKQENEKHKKQNDSTNSPMEESDEENEESNRSGQGIMDFLDSMADEGEESSASDDSNAIPDEGESVGYSSNDNNPDESYELDSFIDDEEYELLSGSEYASGSEKESKLEASEEVEEGSSSTNKKWTRIVTIDSSSEEDDNVAVSASEVSLEVHASSSSEDEAPSPKAKRSSLNKSHLKQTSHCVEEVSDASPVAISTKSTNTSITIRENDTQTPHQIDQNSGQEVCEAEISHVFISPKPRKTSITIQENISVQDIKDESLRETISDVVDMFCKRSMTQGEITLNVSLNYTPTSPGIRHSSENINGGTIVAYGEKISYQETSTASKKRRQRSRKRKPKNLNTEDRCRQKSSESASTDYDVLERQVDRKQKGMLRKQLDTNAKVCLHSPGQNDVNKYCKENEPITEFLSLGNRKQRKRRRNKKKASVEDLTRISAGEIYHNSKDSDKFDRFVAKDKKVKTRPESPTNESHKTESPSKRRKISASTSSNDPSWTMEIANMKPSGSSNQQINRSSSHPSQTAFHPEDFRSRMLYDGKGVQKAKMSKILKRK